MSNNGLLGSYNDPVIEELEATIAEQAATIERFRAFVDLADTYFGGDWCEPKILYPETVFARMKVSRKNLTADMGEVE